MNPLKQLFLSELADHLDAAKRLPPVMSDMLQAATGKGLPKLLKAHLKETEKHVKKLEKVFKAFDAKVTLKKCEATIGLIKEGEEIILELAGSPAINAALIGLAQKVEHHEIASYGCLHEWATVLGNKKAAEILGRLLEEAKDANDELVELACSRCNLEAMEEGNHHHDGAGDGHPTRAAKRDGMLPLKGNRRGSLSP